MAQRIGIAPACDNGPVMRTRFLAPALLAAVALALGCGGGEREKSAPAAPPAAEAPSGGAPAPGGAPPAAGETLALTTVRDEGLEAVHEYTRMFYAGELERLHERFSPEMRSEVLPLEKLRGLREFVREKYGDEVEVLNEQSQTKGDYRGFARFARFSKHEGPIEVQWILRPDHTVAGFFVQPAGGAAKRP